MRGWVLPDKTTCERSRWVFHLTLDLLINSCQKGLLSSTMVWAILPEIRSEHHVLISSQCYHEDFMMFRMMALARTSPKGWLGFNLSSLPNTEGPILQSLRVLLYWSTKAFSLVFLNVVLVFHRSPFYHSLSIYDYVLSFEDIRKSLLLTML